MPQVPRLPRKTKVDVRVCHACHVKRTSMSPSATPATQSADICDRWYVTKLCVCVKFVCVCEVIVCVTMCKMVCDEGVCVCEVMYVKDNV